MELSEVPHSVVQQGANSILSSLVEPKEEPLDTPDSSPLFPLEPKEEEIDDFAGFPTHNETSCLDLGGNEIKDEEILNYSVVTTIPSLFPLEPKEEEFDSFVVVPPENVNSVVNDTAQTGATFLNKSNSYVNNLGGNAYCTISFGSGGKATFDNQVSCGSNLSGSAYCTKRTSTNDTVSNSESSTKKPRLTKRSDTELKCPECNFHTNSVPSWLSHLNKQHLTTPGQAGVALRCECGNESTSAKHSKTCNIANFTVIRTKEGTRRLEERQTTPQQCILCEKFPSTPFGYIHHLQHYHKSTLKVNGIYLKCVCGFAIYSNGNPQSKHVKECDRRAFTVHKIEEK